MTQSLPHIKLGYSGFSICACVFYSLTFTASSLPSPPPTVGKASALTSAAAAAAVAMVAIVKP